MRRPAATLIQTVAQLSDRAVAGAPKNLTRRDITLAVVVPVVVAQQPLLEARAEVVEVAAGVGLTG